MPNILAMRPNWDRFAIGLSGLCAIHCAGTLLLLGAVSSLAHVFTSPLIHEGGLAVAIILGAVALGMGAMKHGQLVPVAIGSLGLGVMIGALSMPHSEEEAIYNILGVGTLALGHYLNLLKGC